MTTQRKDLIMTKDTVIDGDLIAANITGKDGERYNLTVRGNINAHDIDAYDINALDINAHDIDAYDINALNIDAHDIDACDIDAWNIDAWNIDAWNINAKGNLTASFILCEKIAVKLKATFKV